MSGARAPTSRRTTTMITMRIMLLLLMIIDSDNDNNNSTNHNFSNNDNICCRFKFVLTRSGTGRRAQRHHMMLLLVIIVINICTTKNNADGNSDNTDIDLLCRWFHDVHSCLDVVCCSEDGISCQRALKLLLLLLILSTLTLWIALNTIKGISCRKALSRKPFARAPRRPPPRLAGLPRWPRSPPAAW